MNLRGQKANRTAGAEDSSDDSGRCLSLLADGAAMNALDVEEASYQEFRGTIKKLTLQIPDHTPLADKLAIVQEIVQEFENYRKKTDETVRNRQAGWKGLAAQMLREVLRALGIDSGAPGVAALAQAIAGLTTADEIGAYGERLARFLHPGESAAGGPASPLKAADRSTTNNNASGLNGGGIAVERLRKVMEKGNGGFVVLFSLSCLEMIDERFGAEAVQDALMAVSAFLTQSLHAADAIYHWSDSSLLAIAVDRANEQILTAELRRIVAQNRDITIHTGGRSIMLRIPLNFDITPIAHFESAEDIYKLTPSGR